MFLNIGPLELVVLAFVGLIVIGPEKMPGLARDAARLLKGLREMATGARTQLREELGPEFADIDLRSLNPRTAITQALLGDEVDPRTVNSRAAWQRALLGDPNAGAAGADSGAGPDGTDPKPATRPAGRPSDEPGAPGRPTPFDADAT